MRRLLSLVALASLLVLPALAQEPKKEPKQEPKKPKAGLLPGGLPGGFPGGLSYGVLLNQKSVQEELKLTDDQLAKVKELADKQLKAREELQKGDRAEFFKKMMELSQAQDKEYLALLKPEQGKRLKQITLQVQGARALQSTDVAKELGITTEQQEKFREFQMEGFKQMAQLSNVTNFEEARQKMQDINKATLEKITKALTPEQQAKWKTMTGEPFKGEIQIGFPGLARPPQKEKPKDKDK